MTRTGAMRSTRVATSFTPADDGRLVAQTWLGSRAILFIVAVVGMAGYHRTFSQVTGNWDVQHFMSIARNGYADPLEMAFFPGLPALLKVGSLIGLPMEVTGVLLGLVGSALAAWALFRIGGTVPACLWLIAPTAVFTVVGYTESPFCAAAFWSWERARAGKWWPAALLAGLACTFRVSGLFLVGALAVMAVLGDGDQRRPTSQAARRRRNTEIVNRLSTLLVPAAVLVAFAVWLHRLTGSWTAWSQAQTKGWGRGFTTPVETLRHTLPATHPETWEATYGSGAAGVAIVFRLELVSVVLGILVFIYCLIRRRWASAAWVGIQVVAFSIGYWYMSVNRATLLWFPLFVALAELTRGPSKPPGLVLLWRGIMGIVVVVDLAVVVWWGWRFFTGGWAS
ncbi:mannosyltransferase family protein [Cutibacterium avidum]|uniref:Membrane protein n=1 Tax=Cutibacterium avidum ATCC 25577 TaxID=997355 RepID=G4CXA3_9ACTN|nr:mannosyltransferase family protein [Cutibacterium avidum]EGY77617.1 membrane protein [Cutibacterium avidum ATCC 25577]MDQ9042883.1 mannosyltransferase family protein [Cutibacterium avidum]MDU1726531.1 mannosyltransferase family protein [Cutibacterium avidum]MDU2312990.1 mannosyltransferase family protein [Cutibacterium avidum]MDU2351079.1 mannosyltransferase family protein [Cutibacterium avidum]